MFSNKDNSGVYEYEIETYIQQTIIRLEYQNTD